MVVKSALVAMETAAVRHYPTVTIGIKIILTKNMWFLSQM